VAGGGAVTTRTAYRFFFLPLNIWLLLLRMRYGGLLLVLLILGCSAERQNFLARNYHTFVSYFNGYYHADKRFRTAQAEIELKTPDPTEGYVRVFPLIDPAIAREHYGRLEEATKKCEVIIFRHKNGKYIDDCRTLIGQCWVLRSNLPNAEQNFTYVLSAFPKTPLRPKVYWWEAYAALHDNNPYRAETRLTEILKMPAKEVPKQLRAEADVLLAQALIDKGEPALAIKFLERSAGKLNSRIRRARAFYLLGQLYLEQSKPDAALQAFQKVVRLNPTNQLTFQAQLQKSLLAGSRDPRLIRRLERMAQQARYEDYRDQIYYRLGHIALESKNYETALAYFKKAGSAGNSPARALAHYEAGNLYFMQYQDLSSAQKHYDSAATLIPEKHPRAPEIKAVQSRFQEYGRLRTEVRLYDSLLTLSGLSPEELDRALEAYIQSEVSRRAAEKARQQAQTQEASATSPNPLLQQRQGSSGGGFYFDNPMLVSQGKQEFKRQWGDRPDEDHWRRRQKTTVATTSATSGETPKSTSESDSTKVVWPDDPAALTPQKVALLKRQLRATIPQSPTQKRALEDSLITSALLLAQLYQEAFQRPDSAKKIYTWLYHRLPHRSEAQAPALYGLYVLTAGTPEAEKPKQELLSRYPDSEYAQRLRGGRRLDEKSTVEDIHAALLEAYEREEYETVVGFAKVTQNRWEKTASEPAIRYLLAAALTHLQNYEEAKAHLRLLIQNFPQAPCTPTAQKLLARLEKGQTQLLAEANPTPAAPSATAPTPPSSTSSSSTPFSLEPRSNEPILVLLLVPKDRIASDDLKQHLARTHQTAFADSRLNLVVFLYEQSYHLAYIAQFSDYRAADAYISTIASQPWFQSLQLRPNQDIFPITQSNFRIAYTQKRLHEYAAFFAQNRPQSR
jgi:tetratricopeptide (TPR) repeat protein